MKTGYENIKALGLDEWFLDKAEPSKMESFQVARVIAVHRDSYVITDGRKDIQAELLGSLKYRSDSPLDYPAVGDWVYANFYDDDTFAVIHDIFPRKSLIKRKTPGKKIDFQLIAANIDTAFIVQSFDMDFNLRRLERYLAMIYEGSIVPVVLLGKSDLAEQDEIIEKTREILDVYPDIKVQPFSNYSMSGLSEIKGMLVAGNTYCLLGSSGVGKTTLLNALLGGVAEFRTGEVRDKDGRGRHVTTGRHLLILNNGAMVIDNPGMRELGNFLVQSGIDETFSEITELAKQCRFSDCTHLVEKGCAVIGAVESGTVPEERYRNYIKMMKEAAFNEMSYAEKRKKDKEFGKMVKSVMKHKKKDM